MTLRRFFWPLLLVFAFSGALATAQVEEIQIFVEDDDEEDLILPFIDEKREVSVTEKPNLAIAGDVRWLFRKVSEKVDGLSVLSARRLPADFPRISKCNDVFRVEANLYVDYSTDCTWASISLEFENLLGKATGTFNKLRLERALFGYTLFEEGDIRMYVELGRQGLFEKFDSDVQFSSRLDGIFGYFGRPLWRSSFYVQGAFLIIDCFHDEFAWIMETGLKEIWGSNFYFKYSIIDWGHLDVVGLPADLEGFDAGERNFLIHQWIIGYRIKNCWREQALKAYVGFLWNQDAKPLARTRGRHENIGAFFGIEFGKVYRKGDWAARFQLQYVEALAILESDNNGIGRGNSAGFSIFGSDIIAARARGNTNYWGPSIEYAYAFTDHLTMRLQYQHSNQIAHDIGGENQFSKAEIRFVYSF